MSPTVNANQISLVSFFINVKRKRIIFMFFYIILKYSLSRKYSFKVSKVWKKFKIKTMCLNF